MTFTCKKHRGDLQPASCLTCAIAVRENALLCPKCGTAISPELVRAAANKLAAKAPRPASLGNTRASKKEGKS